MKRTKWDYALYGQLALLGVLGVSRDEFNLDTSRNVTEALMWITLGSMILTAIRIAIDLKEKEERGEQ